MKQYSKKQIVMDYIISEINNGNLSVGDEIPTEKELVEKFNFSRQTIHKALYELSVLGVIERIRGKGSFVCHRKVNRNIKNLMSFSEDMESIGVKPGAILLEYKIIEAKVANKIAKELEINKDSQLYYIKRLRTGNNTPIAIQEHYIPRHFFENIDISRLTESIDSYYIENKIFATDFYTRLRAVEATEEQKQILKTNNDALLNSISIRYLKDKTPIQYTSTFYNSDLYEYTFTSF